MSNSKNTHTSSSTKSSETNQGTQKKIPVIEEQLSIDKELVKTGEYRIHKKVHEEDVQLNLQLARDVTDVKRVEMNRFLDAPPEPVRQEGNTTIIPVLREVLVKRLLLVEEIHITKSHQKTEHDETITLRKEEVEVEFKPSPDNTPKSKK